MWTQEELAYLKEAYERGDSTMDISKVVNHTQSAIRQQAKRYGIKHKRYYSDDDKEQIRKYVGRKSPKAIAKIYGRNYKTMQQYITQYIGTIPENTDDLHVAEIGRLLGIHRNNVLRMCRRGLKSRMVGRYRFVKEKDLVSFLTEHPERWDATKCEKWYFQKYSWFEEKRKSDFDKMVKRRWGNVV